MWRSLFLFSPRMCESTRRWTSSHRPLNFHRCPVDGTLMSVSRAPHPPQLGGCVCMHAVRFPSCSGWVRLSDPALMSNTQLYECLCTSCSPAEEQCIAEQLRDSSSSPRGTQESPPPASCDYQCYYYHHTVLKGEPWHFTRAGVRLVW